MHLINEHEFVENSHGELALLLNVLSFDDAVDPVLLVSCEENKAYLQRSPDDIHEIGDINPTVIEQLRAANNVLVVEMTGEKVTHSYDALTGILEDDEDEDAENDDLIPEEP